MPASASSWRNKPFTSGVPLPYRRLFSDAQVAQLMEGLIPQVMEDKWFIYYERPYLFLHRSWTGDPVYRLRMTPLPGGAEISEALWSLNHSFVEKVNSVVEEAEKIALFSSARVQESRMVDFLLSNLLLNDNVPFPTPDMTPQKAAIFQHAVSGTAYPGTYMDEAKRQPYPTEDDT